MQSSGQSRAIALTEWDPAQPAAGQQRRMLGRDLRIGLGEAQRQPAAAYTCWRLFAQGDPVRIGDVRRALGSGLAILAAQSGLLVSLEDVDDLQDAPEDTFVRSVACVAEVELPTINAWVASDFGWQDDEPGYVGGPGNAALTLARSMVTTALDTDGWRTVVDLGTGSGALAILLAQVYDNVIVTDINPRALAYAELTAALNGVAWDCALGDFAEALPVDGRGATSPHYIVCNPPFVLGNPDGPHGFRDAVGGEDQPCQLIAEFSSVLQEDGVGQFLANWVYRDRTADPIQTILDYAKTHECDALVIERAAVAPATYVDLWVPERGDHHAAWTAGLDQNGVIAIGTGIVTLRRRRAGSPVVMAHRAHDNTDVSLAHPIARWLTRVRCLGALNNDINDLVVKAAPYVATHADGQVTVRVDDELGLSIHGPATLMDAGALPLLEHCASPRLVTDLAAPGLNAEDVADLAELFLRTGLLEPADVNR